MLHVEPGDNQPMECRESCQAEGSKEFGVFEDRKGQHRLEGVKGEKDHKDLRREADQITEGRRGHSEMIWSYFECKI